MAIEEPKFDLVERLDEVEIRAYAPHLVAETEVEGPFERAGNEAFRRLAGYIFGGNRARQGGSAEIAMTAPVGMRPERSEKIAMTAPVGMKREAAGGSQGDPPRWTMTFAMPREWTMGSLPEPLDARVVLREIPGRTVAALRFSGLWSEARFAERERRLRERLANSGWSAIGLAESARYDPPWIPWFLRRNEVLIEVERVP